MRSKHYIAPFIFLLVLLPFTACVEKSASENRPPNLLSDEAFVDLLVNFSISESASSINIKQVANLKFDSVYAFYPLTEKNIRKSQYDSTLAYYAGHIGEYKAIYETVLERISALQAQGIKTRGVKTQE